MRVAVVGAGRWGCMHASKLALHPEVDLVAIVDVDAVRAMEAARVYGALHWCTHVDESLDLADAYTVAVPIGQLFTVTERLVANGKHVLVEKPGAVSAARLRKIARAAKSAGVVVGLGYLERFNAAAAGLRRGVRNLVIWRAAPSRPRASGMALDWTCHDIDLALWLTNDALTLNAVEGDLERSIRLKLAGTQGAQVRLQTRSCRQAVRRRVWADGQRVDLVRSAGDALHEQIAAFVDWAQGRARGHLATIDEAIEVLELLGAISTGGIEGVVADGARSLHLE